MRFYIRSKLPLTRYYERKNLTRILRFAREAMFSDNPDIKIWIEITERVGYDNMGLCFPLQDGKYRIMIDPKLDKENLLKTIFHELAHVKQYHTGQLIQQKQEGRGFEWQGAKYHYNEFRQYQLPYEAQAVRQEQKLYNMFMELKQNETRAIGRKRNKKTS